MMFHQATNNAPQYWGTLHVFFKNTEQSSWLRSIKKILIFSAIEGNTGNVIAAILIQKHSDFNRQASGKSWYLRAIKVIAYQWLFKSTGHAVFDVRQTNARPKTKATIHSD